MKRKIRCLCFILSAALIIVIAIVFITSRQINHTYETSDEIRELFMENVDDLNIYVDKFNQHDMWSLYHRKIGNWADGCSNYKALKEFTTKEEYEFLDSFFQKYRPSQWDRFGVSFSTKYGNMRFMKTSLDETYVENRASQAESDGFVVDYYDDGWVSIDYANHKR